MSEPFKVAYTCLCLPTHKTETSSSLTRSCLFQVHESKVVIEEGLMPEKLSSFDRAEQVSKWWNEDVSVSVIEF